MTLASKNIEEITYDFAGSLFCAQALSYFSLNTPQSTQHSLSLNDDKY